MINMTPPTTRSALRFSSEKHSKVKIYGTLLFLIVDPEDFEEIRDSRVVWSAEKGFPCMANGNTIEEFLGINGKRKGDVHATDYRRCNYETTIPLRDKGSRV